MNLGTVAEWVGALLSGIAIIMIVWQVTFEKKNTIKQQQLDMIIEKQSKIINLNNEFYLLINQYNRLLHENENNNYEINIIEQTLRGLIISINNENDICQFLFVRYKIEKFNDISEDTSIMNKLLKSKVKNTEKMEKVPDLAIYNFDISNKCRNNIKLILKNKR